MRKNEYNISSYFQLHFPWFESSLIQAIEDVGVVKHIKANTIVIEPGGSILSFPILLHGVVEVYKSDEQGREILLYYLSSGELCASMLMCCANNTPIDVWARTFEECTILRIPLQYLDIWMTQYPSWKQYVFQQYRVRFNELLNTIDSLAFMHMDERLVRFFKTMYETTGKTIFEGTHSDIASSLSTSREVISRLLKTLENQQKVKLSRNKIDFSQLV